VALSLPSNKKGAMERPNLYTAEVSDIQEYFRQTITYSYGEKEKSDEFCGFYVHGTDKPFLLQDHEVPIRCFRHFSKYSYPLYLMYNEEQPGEVGELLKRYDNVIAIPIKPLKSIIHYDNFVIYEVFDIIKHNNILTMHPDGFLINSGWEDFLKVNDVDYIGAAWRNTTDHSILLRNHDRYNIQMLSKVGNSGFSFRKRDLCMKVVEAVDGDDVNWKHNGCTLPDDVFFSYFGFGLGIFRPCSVELANQWSLEPMASWDTYGFHKTQIQFRRKYELLFSCDVEVIKAPKKEV
jgi:hypothetical protein